MARKFPDRYKPSTRVKRKPGDLKTVQGEVLPLSSMLTDSGIPYAQDAVKPDLYFHEDLSEMTEDQYDFPDGSKFAKLDPVDQDQAIVNIQGLADHFARLVAERKAIYEAEVAKRNPVQPPVEGDQPETPVN